MSFRISLIANKIGMSEIKKYGEPCFYISLLAGLKNLVSLILMEKYPLTFFKFRFWLGSENLHVLDDMSSKMTLKFRKIAKYENHFLQNRENIPPCRK